MLPNGIGDSQPDLTSVPPHSTGPKSPVSLSEKLSPLTPTTPVFDLSERGASWRNSELIDIPYKYDLPSHSCRSKY